MRSHIGLGVNEVFFIRVWKPLPSICVLRGSLGGKTQKGQYLLGVGLGRYKCVKGQLCLVLTKTDTKPKGCTIGQFYLVLTKIDAQPKGCVIGQFYLVLTKSDTKSKGCVIGQLYLVLTKIDSKPKEVNFTWY